jgi:hypothetical protein
VNCNFIQPGVINPGSGYFSKTTARIDCYRPISKIFIKDQAGQRVSAGWAKKQAKENPDFRLTAALWRLLYSDRSIL